MLHGRTDRAVEDQAMPLVVVGPSVILPDVVVVDRRAEEEFTHIVQGLRVSVGDTVVSPANGPLQIGDVQAIVMRIGQGRVLAVVRVVRVRTASVVGPGGNTGGHVLIDGYDE